MIIDRISGEYLPGKLTATDKETIVKSGSLISPEIREKRYGQRGSTLWITGLHGSGKNQLAYTLERALFEQGKTVVVFDGKSVRSGLSKELDYSPGDSAKHLLRVAHMCRLLNDQGIITICSFISPDQKIRDQVKEIINQSATPRFYLFHLNIPLDLCIQNDKYGLYKLALEGAIDFLPGINSPYDMPQSADIMLDNETVEHLEPVFEFLRKQGIISE